MSWIEVIPYKEAGKVLKKLYDRVKGPNDNVDNVLSIHSLRPHTLTGHMTLYKAVLHNSNNTLPKWYLETIGVCVSKLNKCDYCVQHHAAGLKRLLNDDDKFDALILAIEEDLTSDIIGEKLSKGIGYAVQLTLKLDSVTESDIVSLRKVGFTDGEILEVNQVASYFNYVNRMVVGLGVDTKGDIIGLSPNENDDPSNWSHN